MTGRETNRRKVNNNKSTKEKRKECLKKKEGKGRDYIQVNCGKEKRQTGHNRRKEEELQTNTQKEQIQGDLLIYTEGVC